MNIYTIYKAENLINGKVYIGFTQNFQKRKKDHIIRALDNIDKSYYSAFHEAIKKYGADNFSWEIVYQSKELDHTKNVMENHFIVEYNSYVGFENCNEYNLTLGGEGSNGRECKDSTKQKIGEKAVERYKNPENRKKQSIATTKWWESFPEERKKEFSEQRKGFVNVKNAITWESIGKVPVDHPKILSGEWVSSAKGFNHSEETKRNMSKSKMGKNPYERTPETNKNISLGRKGKGTGDNNGMANEENRKKVAASKIGRKKFINPETKESKYYLPGTEPEGFILKSSKPV